jgi:hypothetical protein
MTRPKNSGNIGVFKMNHINFFALHLFLITPLTGCDVCRGTPDCRRIQSIQTVRGDHLRKELNGLNKNGSVTYTVLGKNIFGTQY